MATGCGGSYFMLLGLPSKKFLDPPLHLYINLFVKDIPVNTDLIIVLQMAKIVGSEDNLPKLYLFLLRTCHSWIFPVNHVTFTLW